MGRTPFAAANFSVSSGLGFVALMGVAANAIARMLNRLRWIGYVGAAIVLFVALHMMWDGYRGVVIDLNQIGPYNAIMPHWLDIQLLAPSTLRRF